MPEALPQLTPAEAARAPTWRAAWSLRTAVLMAKLCELAYADRATVANAVRAGGFQLAQWIEADGLSAFLAIAPGEMAVLAFRGTCDLQGWERDFDFPAMAMPGAPGVRVHCGFWTGWTRLRAGVMAAIDINLPPDLGLYITGHSLGGALAQLAAVALERDELAAVYTFGSPRVASLGFDACVKTEHYRVVHDQDLVPAVPPPTPGGYAHSGDPRLLDPAFPGAVLRRDWDIPTRARAIAFGLAEWPLTHRLRNVDDHMITAYRVALEAAAADIH